ncbi:hypothetical protein AB833_31625 [Chromatiales bacterium (ex Bugula neritina AB1)]|nr:hypothetical protein AB833_31625 [Chromatiales bacterium (ex Bugula neritina AB1)]
MTEIAKANEIVLAHYSLLDGARTEQLTGALAEHSHSECKYHFVHPSNDVSGPAQAAHVFWNPIRESFSPLQCRQNIFMAGRNHLDNGHGVWVVSMGHFLCDWTRFWLGVKPSMKTTFVPYVAWYRIVEGAIVETVGSIYYL